MAATTTPDLSPTLSVKPTLSADAIRDVCSRPAVLLVLSEEVPAAAIQSMEQRRQAVADGVARALQLAIALEHASQITRSDQLLLDEATARLWEPIDLERTRVLQWTGPTGLFAYLVVEGAMRREAWRSDTQRRRQERVEELRVETVGEQDRDPVDLTRFRIDVERTAAMTAERIGIPNAIALGLVSSELSYVEAGRRTGRSSNSLWMAIFRLRPEWQGVAARGRAAGLGGGVLVRVSDHVDIAVRRAVRWRLVGGVTASLLLLGTLGALTTASLLEGQAPPTRVLAEPQPEVSAFNGEGPFGPAGRMLALEAARRLSTEVRAPGPKPTRPRAATPASSGVASGAAVPAVSAALLPSTVTVGVANSAPTPACGLGSAALTCR